MKAFLDVSCCFAFSFLFFFLRILFELSGLYAAVYQSTDFAVFMTTPFYLLVTVRFLSLK